MTILPGKFFECSKGCWKFPVEEEKDKNDWNTVAQQASGDLKTL